MKFMPKFYLLMLIFSCRTFVNAEITTNNLSGLNSFLGGFSGLSITDNGKIFIEGNNWDFETKPFDNSITYKSKELSKRYSEKVNIRRNVLYVTRNNNSEVVRLIGETNSLNQTPYRKWVADIDSTKRTPTAISECRHNGFDNFCLMATANVCKNLSNEIQKNNILKKADGCVDVLSQLAKIYSDEDKKIADDHLTEFKDGDLKSSKTLVMTLGNAVTEIGVVSMMLGELNKICNELFLTQDDTQDMTSEIITPLPTRK